MIGGGNFAMAPAYLYSEDDTKLQMRQDRMRLNIQEASVSIFGVEMTVFVKTNGCRLSSVKFYRKNRKTY
jgi:hypothetical protein